MTRLFSILLLVALCSFTTTRNVPQIQHNEHAFCSSHHHHHATGLSLFSFFADRDATAAEKQDAFNKIEAYRTANNLTSNTKRGSNLGYVEGSITNAGVTRTFTINTTAILSNSGIVPDPNIFTAITVGTYVRTTDSEYQMLSLLAKNNFSAVRGSVFTGATGTIKIVSERPYCASCDDVSRVQFKRMFPNVNLIFVSGAP